MKKSRFSSTSLRITVNSWLRKPRLDARFDLCHRHDFNKHTKVPRQHDHSAIHQSGVSLYVLWVATAVWPLVEASPHRDGYSTKEELVCELISASSLSVATALHLR